MGWAQLVKTAPEQIHTKMHDYPRTSGCMMSGSGSTLLSLCKHINENCIMTRSLSHRDDKSVCQMLIRSDIWLLLLTNRPTVYEQKLLSQGNNEELLLVLHYKTSEQIESPHPPVAINVWGRDWDRSHLKGNVRCKQCIMGAFTEEQHWRHPLPSPETPPLMSVCSHV